MRINKQFIRKFKYKNKDMTQIAWDKEIGIWMWAYEECQWESLTFVYLDLEKEEWEIRTEAKLEGKKCFKIDEKLQFKYTRISINSK